MAEKIFTDIEEEIKNRIESALGGAGYERIASSTHQVVFGKSPEFEFENWGNVDFEVDCYRRIERRDVLILPEELIGGRTGFYAFYVRPRKPS